MSMLKILAIKSLWALFNETLTYSFRYLFHAWWSLPAFQARFFQRQRRLISDAIQGRFYLLGNVPVHRLLEGHFKKVPVIINSTAVWVFKLYLDIFYN